MVDGDEGSSGSWSGESSLLGAVAQAPPRPPLELAGTRIWSDLPDGLWVDDKYQIQGKPVGQGAFGIVYRAWDEYLADHVALKILQEDAEGNEAQLARIFQQAARAHHRLNHANIVGFRAWGFWGGAPYLVFELVKGISLRERLRGDVPLPADEAMEIALQLADALVHAHTRAQPVYHQDLKPENVLITADQQVKVLDFGLADLQRAWFGVGSSEAPSRVGTPRYMSPEQWRADPSGTGADLWALGVLLFEMLAGRHPLDGIPSERDIRERVLDEQPLSSLGGSAPAIAAPIVALVDRALAKREADRFESAEDFRNALSRIAGRSPAGDRATAGGEEPFRYLEPFREVDRAWFFGREREVGELVHLATHRPAVLVLGPSGAGKTSLLQAGLIPRLRCDPAWRLVLEIRPGTDPLRSLQEALLAYCQPAAEGLADQPADLVARLAGGVLRAHARGLGGRILLVVDQFEELYTLVSDPVVRNLFVTSLVSGLGGVGDPIRVVIAGRSDFLDDIAQHSRGLWDALHRNLYLLAPPGRDQLRSALCEPVRILGYDWEEDLAEEIVDGVATEPAPLPFLQLTASQLWAERAQYERPHPRAPDRRLVPREALTALGGVTGVVTAYADRVLAGIPPAQREVARRVLCSLVTEERTRQRRDLSELRTSVAKPAEVDEVVGRLVQGRLLTSFQDSRGVEVVELAHEALLERWETLRNWLDGEGDLNLYRHRLRRSAAEWHHEGKRRDMLWRGRQLRDESRRTRRYRDPLTGPELEFLRASEKRAANRIVLLVVGLGVVGLGIAFLVAIISFITPQGFLAAIFSRLGGKSVTVEAFSTLPHFVLAGHRGPVTFAAFGPRAKWIATSGEDGTVRLWDLANSLPRAKLLRGHTGAVSYLAFSPGGGSLVSCSVDGTARLWDVARGQGSVVLRGHSGPVRHGAFSPDGRLLATASDDGTARIWSTTRSDDPRVLSGHRAAVVQVAFSPDGTRVLTASKDGTARLWAVATSKATVVLRGHERPLLRAALGKPGKDLLVLTTSEDGTARLWRASGELVHEFDDEDDPIAQAAFSPDGKRIVTVSKGGSATIYTASWKRTRIPSISGSVLMAAFGKDGKEILVITTEGASLLGRFRRESTFLGHSDVLTHAALSPLGKHLVTTSRDGTAQVYLRDERTEWKEFGDSGWNVRVKPATSQ